MGIPHTIKVNIRTWKCPKPMHFEPKPLCNQKKMGAKANAIKVGLLNIPITVIIAIFVQWFKECGGNEVLSL